MITRKIKIETISKVKDFVNEISKVDVNADLSNPDRRYIVDAKSILGILSLDISHVMNLTIYDEEKNAGRYEKIFEEFGVRDNNQNSRQHGGGRPLFFVAEKFKKSQNRNGFGSFCGVEKTEKENKIWLTPGYR